MHNPRLENFLRSPAVAAPNASWLEVSRLEMPVDVLSARRDPSGPAGIFAGLFRPPVSSNYTFVVVADDQAAVWLGRDEDGDVSRMEKIIDSSNWAIRHEWYVIYPYKLFLIERHLQECCDYQREKF